MRLVEGTLAIAGILVLAFITWLVERYKKDKWDDLDFYDGEES
jgi:hypothetical protein